MDPYKPESRQRKDRDDDKSKSGQDYAVNNGNGNSNEMNQEPSNETPREITESQNDPELNEELCLSVECSEIDSIDNLNGMDYIAFILIAYIGFIFLVIMLAMLAGDDHRNYRKDLENIYTGTSEHLFDEFHMRWIPQNDKSKSSVLQCEDLFMLDSKLEIAKNESLKESDMYISNCNFPNSDSAFPIESAPLGGIPMDDSNTENVFRGCFDRNKDCEIVSNKFESVCGIPNNENDKACVLDKKCKTQVYSSDMEDAIFNMNMLTEVDRKEFQTTGHDCEELCESCKSCDDWTMLNEDCATVDLDKMKTNINPKKGLELDSHSKEIFSPVKNQAGDENNRLWIGGSAESHLKTQTHDLNITRYGSVSNVDKSDIFQHWNDHDINYQAENEMDHRDDDDDDDDDGGESNFQLPTEYHINYDGDDELDVANDYEDVIDHEFEEAGNQNIIPEDYLPTFDLPEQIDDTGYDGDDELDAFSDNEDATDYEFEEAGSQNILPEDDLPIFVLSEQIDYVPQNQISNIVNNISWDQTLIENDSAYTENVEVQCMEKE